MKPARYWSQVASTSLAMMGLIWCGQDASGALPPGAEITKSSKKQEQNPTSTLIDKTS